MDNMRRIGWWTRRDRFFGIDVVHVRDAPFYPSLLKYTHVLFSRTEVSRRREGCIVMALDAEIVTISLARIICPPVIGVVIVVVSANSAHPDAAVWRERNVVGVAKEDLACCRLPVRSGVRTS